MVWNPPTKMADAIESARHSPMSETHRAQAGARQTEEGGGIEPYLGTGGWLSIMKFILLFVPDSGAFFSLRLVRHLRHFESPVGTY